MNKEFYCYNIKDEDACLLKNIAESMGISVYHLDDTLMDKTVDEILREHACGECGCSRFDMSFILMKDISDDELRIIHEKTDSSQWSQVPVKMMVTEHNRQWKLEALFEEVKKEHLLFSKVEQIAGLMKKLNDTDMSQWNSEKKEAMKMAVMKAYILLNSGNFTEQNVEESLKELSEFTGE